MKTIPKSRMYILTEIEASKRVEIRKEKEEYWKGYTIAFGLLTAIAWTFFILIETGLWTLAKSADPMVLMGLLIPVFAYCMRELDIAQWRPPTAEEMTELGDRII